MEDLKNTVPLLDQISQPGFLVKNHQIIQVNQSASAMLLCPGQDFDALLCTGREEYEDGTAGQLCLTLMIGGREHGAAILRMEDADLVLLDSLQDQEEFRSMALVSMELRMPLMQAINSARQLEAEAAPAAAKMNQSLMQLLRLVSNMADISRYTASARMELRDVDSFLTELFEKARTLAPGSISVTFDGLQHPVFSRMDPEQLERAVWNILSNCIKFMPEGGTIAAKLVHRGNRLQLTIADSGSGIAGHIRSTLFQRYLRQPGIEDSRYGLGLGMAIVRTVAANHGGTVLISGGIHGGTTVTLTFPIRQDGGSALHSPVFRPDYTGGFDHGLVELSDCLTSEAYQEL